MQLVAEGRTFCKKQQKTNKQRKNLQIPLKMPQMFPHMLNTMMSLLFHTLYSNIR